MSFANDIGKFNEKVEDRAEKLLRAVSLEMFGRIVTLTPVGNTGLWKTKYPPKGYVGGRLRGNWQYTLGKPASGTLKTPDKSGKTSIAKAANKSSIFRLGGKIFITNNLPYAIPIENGHSSQAPAGMVKITVAQFKRIIKKNLAKVKRT